jgi:hypothetical protein
MKISTCIMWHIKHPNDSEEVKLKLKKYYLAIIAFNFIVCNDKKPIDLHDHRKFL